jgi:hypothetical protein
MLNELFDGDRPNIPLLTALSARFTMSELYQKMNDNEQVICHYWPHGKEGARRIWKGYLDRGTISTIRRLLGIVKGREDIVDAVCDGPPSWLANLNCKVDAELQTLQAPVLCQTRDGYDRIQTFKWTTDGTTRRKLPPGSLVWRDLYTGKVYVKHPSDEAVAM